MTAGRTTTRKDRVEMAYASGLIPEEIAIRLRVPLAEVLKVGEAMDAAARETDHARNDRCMKGLHAMTPENTYRNKRGGACCRACKRAANKASNDRRPDRQRRRKAA